MRFVWYQFSCDEADLLPVEPPFTPNRRAMKLRHAFSNVLIGTATVLFGTAHSAAAGNTVPVIAASASNSSVVARDSVASATSMLTTRAKAALAALSSSVRQMSHPRALEDAFHSYFAFKSAHPDEVRKPYLYFVDYGLPSTSPRGYVFDMDALRVIDGPFTVAHGRGSAAAGATIPTRFSNAIGSAATSLGLYVADATYGFVGTAGGHRYHSIGLRLDGVSDGFNDNALARKVVAHGAPYVTATKAGRSEGCPAMDQARAQRLLPKLANGGMVFLFAPDVKWLSSDPWLG